MEGLNEIWITLTNKLIFYSCVASVYDHGSLPSKNFENVTSIAEEQLHQSNKKSRSNYIIWFEWTHQESRGDRTKYKRFDEEKLKRLWNNLEKESN